MILPDKEFDYLLYLAEEIDYGTDFDKHARQFKQLAEALQKRIYHYCADPDILDMADKLPTINLQPHQRSFLEQMLPKSGRSMVGDYKTKEAIRTQVKDSTARFKEIRRWLGEG